MWNSSGALRLLSLFNVSLLFLVTDNWSNISRKSFRAIKLPLEGRFQPEWRSINRSFQYDNRKFISDRNQIDSIFHMKGRGREENKFSD